MSISSCRWFSLFLLTVSVSAYASLTDTASAPHPQSSFSAAPLKTYDQIVRLSFVEGDVRISRGKQGERATGGVWGQATAGIPIETGFNLATGKGRAEIELEDASTVYLGEGDRDREETFPAHTVTHRRTQEEARIPSLEEAVAASTEAQVAAEVVAGLPEAVALTSRFCFRIFEFAQRPPVPNCVRTVNKDGLFISDKNRQRTGPFLPSELLAEKT
jgi:hypothetical protein